MHPHIWRRITLLASSTRSNLTQQVAPNIRWTRVESFKAIRYHLLAGNGYWFLQQPYGSGGCSVGVCMNGEPPNQLFRKVIATSLGCPEAFDWKDTSGEDRIAAT